MFLSFSLFFNYFNLYCWHKKIPIVFLESEWWGHQMSFYSLYIYICLSFYRSDYCYVITANVLNKVFAYAFCFVICYSDFLTVVLINCVLYWFAVCTWISFCLFSRVPYIRVTLILHFVISDINYKVREVCLKIFPEFQLIFLHNSWFELLLITILIRLIYQFKSLNN